MAPITSLKLTYFDSRGRAEVCRWVIQQAGLEFEDKRVDQEQWVKIKQDSPTTLAPVAEIDGKLLSSTTAISKFVALEYDMMGADNWEASEIQMCVDLVGDAITAAISYACCKDKNNREVLKKIYTDTALPRLISFTNRRLKEGKDWLVGNKISLADITVAQFLHDQWEQQHKDMIADDAAVSSFVQRVASQPNIKKWIETRPDTPH